MKNDFSKGLAIDASIWCESSSAKYLSHLYRNSLAGLIELMYNGISIDVLLGSQFKQHVPNSCFTTRDVTCQPNNSWHPSYAPTITTSIFLPKMRRECPRL